MQDDLERACLLLTPNGKQPLHLTVVFGKDYPLLAPTVTIESQINHPNVYGLYICASILNTAEGYTSAYTLKSIAIQLLSFFSSERIEQTGGGYSVDLANYPGRDPCRSERQTNHRLSCPKCGFGGFKLPGQDSDIVQRTVLPDPFAKPGVSLRKLEGNGEASLSHGQNNGQSTPGVESASRSTKVRSWMWKRHLGSMHVKENTKSTKQQQPLLIDRILALPDEVLLLVLDELDTVDLTAAGKVCREIRNFMTSYDTIRMRELQCFCLKKNF